MKKILRLTGFIKRYKGYALLNILLNLLTTIFSLFSLSLLIPFLNILFDKVEPLSEPVPFDFTMNSVVGSYNYFFSKLILSEGKPAALLIISVGVIVMFFLRNLCRYMAMYLVAPMRNGVIRDLRQSMYDRLLILPLGYYAGQKKGDLLSRMSNDANEVEWSVMNALMVLFRDPFTILIFIIVLFIISPLLTVIIMAILPLNALLINRIGKRLHWISRKGQQSLGRLMAMLEESLHGLKIIKAYGMIESMDQRFRDRNHFYTRRMNRVYRYRELSAPFTEFMAAAILVFIIWIGGRMVLGKGSLLRPEVFLFYLAVFSQLIPPAKNFITAYYYIEKGLASLDRIEEILHAEEKIVEAPDAIKIETFTHEVAYRDVCFSYGNQTVLQHICFVLPKGKRIALVGPSGAGKSTIADLLPRFYDCSSGEILIDGVDIRKLNIGDLRGLIGLVSQETVLFNDTVFNNIAFGLTNVDEERVISAARLANAHEFIMEMPHAYQTNIGDRGVKLSGGQRQRLSIARAVLRNPPILILDEATASLDMESEKLVHEALLRAMEEKTTLIIAHRLSTVQSADLILVLNHGMIVEKGNHRELYESYGLYRKLCDLQFAG